MSEMIKMNGVKYLYSQQEETLLALDNVSLTIEKGQFVVVIGHNGSGKSTLAKHLNALLLPSEGEVLVNGMNTREEQYTWEIRQAAGMVFQNPDNQIVATVVEEDVAFGPENLGVPPSEIRIRVEDALRSVGMWEHRKKAPHLLSGGQKQRVAIAGVIAMRPNCILLDEPTAMLDPSGRKEVMKTIRRLNREEGISIVHITHFMEEAVEADRVIVMEAGKVLLDGSPKEVFCRVDELKALGLDVPQITDLAHELKKAGISLPDQIITVDEMVMALCQLK